jgi:hypothetical protein
MADHIFSQAEAGVGDDVRGEELVGLEQVDVFASGNLFREHRDHPVDLSKDEGLHIHDTRSGEGVREHSASLGVQFSVAGCGFRYRIAAEKP